MRNHIVRNSLVSPAANGFFSLNQACLQIATTLANVTEQPIIRLLMPNEEKILGIPCYDGQSLADQTENVDSEVNRTIDLHMYRIGFTGRLLHIPSLRLAN